MPKCVACGDALFSLARRGPLGLAGGQAVSVPLSVSTHVYAQARGEPLCLDLYRPAGIRAVVVFAHGGGFRKGSRRQKAAELFAERLAPEGLAVASIDYRLGGGADELAPGDAERSRRLRRRSRRAGFQMRPRLFGAALDVAAQDGALALEFLRKSPDFNGLPMGWIGVSAGGILGALLAVGAHAPACVVSISGPLVRPWLGSVSSAPVLLVHGESDRIIPMDDARLAERIARERGMDLRLLDIGVKGHSGPLAALLDRANPLGNMGFEEVAAFLRAHLFDASL